MRTRLYVKFILFILSCFFLFTACSNGTEPETETDSAIDSGTNINSDGVGSDGVTITDSSGNPTDTEPAETEPDPTKPAEVKVGFIYNGLVTGNSFNTSFESARYEIMKLNGVSTCYVENVLVQQFDDAVKKLKSEGCTVIVAASNHFATACTAAAEEDTDGTYYISYGNLTSRGRMSSLAPALYQPVAVTGYVAAYNTVTNKVGMVIDNNIFHAEGVANAFAQGIKELDNADIELNLNWALSISNADTKRAIDDLVAKDCDVIFLYQTNVYGIEYCEQIGVKVIGYAYNMPELAPENYLTGFYSIPINYVTENVRGAQYNNFKSMVIDQGLQHGYVGMIKLNEEICKEGTAFLTDKYYNYVLDGRAAVFVGEIRDNNDMVRVDKGATLNISQILSIDWLDKNIKNVKNFSEPRSEEQLIFSDLTIYS